MPITLEAVWTEVQPAQVTMAVTKPPVGYVVVSPWKEKYFEGETVTVTYHHPSKDGERVTFKGWTGDFVSADTSMVINFGKKNVSLTPTIDVQYRLRWSTLPATDWKGEEWIVRGLAVVKTPPPDTIVVKDGVYVKKDVLLDGRIFTFKQLKVWMWAPHELVVRYRLHRSVADFNADGKVDEADFYGSKGVLGLLKAIYYYHTSTALSPQLVMYDLSGDGRLGIEDIATFLDYLSPDLRAKIVEGGILTDVENFEVTSLPGMFALQANYPNPFNPVTTIPYDLPKANDATLTIYNINGQEAVTLVSGHQGAGHHTVQWDATGFASGVYICRLQAGEFTATRRMILAR